MANQANQERALPCGCVIVDEPESGSWYTTRECAEWPFRAALGTGDFTAYDASVSEYRKHFEEGDGGQNS